MEALREVAAVRAQELELLRRLHAFADHRELEAVRELQDGAADWRAFSSRATSATKERSIFKVSIGRWRRYDGDEQPVPKSSREIPTPSARSTSRFPRCVGPFSMSSPP